MKVYAVTHGEYSSYTVDYICASEAVAERVAERLNALDRGEWADKFDVEEFNYITDPEADLPLEVRYTVWIDMNGNEADRYSEGVYGEDALAKDETLYVDNLRCKGESNKGFEHALKIARDHLAQEKAKKAGL